MQNDIKDSAEKLADKAAEKGLQIAKTEAPRDKGILIKSHIKEKKSPTKYLIGPDASVLIGEAERDYSLDVHFGTRAHTISVKNKKVLSDGNNIFGKTVNHPGTSPNKWLDRTTNKLENIVEGLFTI